MRAWFLIAAAAAGAAPATAQVAGGPSPLIIDRSRVDRAQPLAPPAPMAGPATLAPEVRADDQGAGVAIAGIRFDGTDVPVPVARAAERFVGMPASRATLEALAAAMSKAYADTEVALYTVLVPDQELVDGVVRVVVAEGFIEHVEIGGDVEGRELRLVKAYARRLTRERPLTRATIERYLSLIRDIPGLTLASELRYGTAPGGVRLALTVKQDRLDLEFGGDNRTSELIGGVQANATAKAYGVAREGDTLELATAATLDLHDYLYAAVTYSTPVGEDGVRLSYSLGALETRPATVPVRGTAVIASLTVSYPLLRSYDDNLTLSASLDGVDSDNALLGNVLSREHSRAVRGAAAFSHARGKSVMSLGVTLSQGLGFLGAEVIAPFAETGFTKVNARIALDQAIGRRAALRLRGSGQFSGDRLPAAERFAVGGSELGRAFEPAIVTGDRGYGGLAELAWRPGIAKALEASELYGFVDGAHVDLLARGPYAGDSYDLASGGGGVRLALFDRALLEVEAAHVLDAPVAGWEDNWRFSLGWRLALR